MKIKGPGESPLLLLNVIKVLGKYRIPYAIVGAFAASFYGLVRASLDADAVISLEGNEKRLPQILSDLKKGSLKVVCRQGDVHDPIRCVIHIKDRYQNRVDLLIGIRGMEQNAFKRVIKASFMNTSIKIIGAEDFIAMKIFAGSAKDMQDAVGVLNVCAKNIDMPLLKQLTLQYGKKELAKLKRILSKQKKE